MGHEITKNNEEEVMGKGSVTPKQAVRAVMHGKGNVQAESRKLDAAPRRPAATSKKG